MPRDIHSRRQGDLGEAAAIEWLTRQGCCVWIPIGHSSDVDVIAQIGNELHRVQVKTSTMWRRGRFDVAVRTSGGNQSWTGIVKKLDPATFDYLFVLVADGRPGSSPPQP